MQVCSHIGHSHSSRPTWTARSQAVVAELLGTSATGVISDRVDLRPAPPRVEMKSFPLDFFKHARGKAANDPSWVLLAMPPGKNCYFCEGSGKCMYDSPAYSGNGKDSYGNPEYYCSGSGKCHKCEGDGIY